jgi:hypothetical protein
MINKVLLKNVGDISVSTADFNNGRPYASFDYYKN